MPKFTFDFVLDLEEVGDKVASMYPLLFTDNKQILEKIDKKDWLNEYEIATGLNNT